MSKRYCYKYCTLLISSFAANSTKLILNGETPLLFHPSLQLCNAKHWIISNLKECTAGERSGPALYSITELVEADAPKRLRDQYIHSINHLSSGKVVIATCDSFLLNLVHLAPLLTATPHTNFIRNQIRRPFTFKQLHESGTLIALLADMEVAALLGFADSFFPTINQSDVKAACQKPEDILPFVLCIWYAHTNSKGMHPCTNQETGTKLLLKEAILKACKYNTRVAAEAQAALANGNLHNHHNDLFNCTSQRGQHHQASQPKAAPAHYSKTHDLEQQILGLQQQLKEKCAEENLPLQTRRQAYLSLSVCVIAFYAGVCVSLLQVHVSAGLSAQPKTKRPRTQQQWQMQLADKS
ncbi:hypothetical protein BDV98DRAFT_586681 [Pterulicium gracile]|uniref:Uncharacterized protein n=1 Tax=Pterulicium gracile TaxID=1884261 RepID=A0A5C3Q2F5_9AGAR|nr:hypothetical protein BDV98DRAFT_586681 [Pterula gracilis]